MRVSRSKDKFTESPQLKGVYGAHIFIVQTKNKGGNLTIAACARSHRSSINY